MSSETTSFDRGHTISCLLVTVALCCTVSRIPRYSGLSSKNANLSYHIGPCPVRADPVGTSECSLVYRERSRMMGLLDVERIISTIR